MFLQLEYLTEDNESAEKLFKIINYFFILIYSLEVYNFIYFFH